MSKLTTTGLTKRFSGLVAVNDVYFNMEEGEILGIIGPNGAGKTTFIHLVSGILMPTSGNITFKGKDITGFPPHKLARIGMGRSFQITSTFTNLTAFQNIRLAILAKDGVRFNLFRKVDKMDKLTEETHEMLKRINLYEDRDTPASALSYGKSRALEISMALATDPELVLLDEFAAGMSKEETHDAVALIRKLTEGKTVVIIEHDMDVVFNLADRITVLHYGKILATGKPDEIRNNQDVKDAYLGDLEV